VVVVVVAAAAAVVVVVVVVVVAVVVVVVVVIVVVVVVIVVVIIVVVTVVKQSDAVGYQIFSNAQNVMVCCLRRSGSIVAPLVVFAALLLGSDFSPIIILHRLNL
jgi:maltodextrin utilization protein YvdJ